MGNQIALELGPAFVRGTIFLHGVPDESLSLACFYSTHYRGTFYLIQYKSSEIEAFKSHAMFSRLESSTDPVFCAGIKHEETLAHIKAHFHIKIERRFTTAANIKALDFLSTHLPDSYFTLAYHSETMLKRVGRLRLPAIRTDRGLPKPLLPCLLVNLRSGLSVYKVTSSDEFVRVGGSSIGGSTFWALMKLMTDYKDPMEAVADAVNGDTTETDMSVGDIYGGDYPSIGLSGDMLASSCAKMREKRPSEMNREDISKSLLTLFAFNVSQIAYLLSQVEQIDTIVIVGSLVSSPEFMQMSQDCMNFCSSGSVKLIFNQHASYLGAWGSLLDRPEFAK